MQDGFAAAIRERCRFRGEGPLEAWVRRMVMNAALKYFRAEPPREVAPSVNGAVPTADAELRGPIADLPERQRTVLFLRHFADLDYRAIGDVLGISPGICLCAECSMRWLPRRSVSRIRHQPTQDSPAAEGEPLRTARREQPVSGSPRRVRR